jgi:GST-like protein
LSSPIDLYFWPTPNGMKVAVLLEELQWPYIVKPVDIGAGAQFDPGFLALSPNNKIPAITDPDGPEGAVSVFESGAILNYLAGKAGRFLGDGARKLAVQEWLFWQVGGFGPMLGQFGHFKTAGEQIPYALKRYGDEAKRLYGVLETRLQGREFVADVYSVADMAIYPWARNWHRHGVEPGDHPNVAAWLERIAARPAVVAAYQRHMK